MLPNSHLVIQLLKKKTKIRKQLKTINFFEHQNFINFNIHKNINFKTINILHEQKWRWRGEILGRKDHNEEDNMKTYIPSFSPNLA